MPLLCVSMLVGDEDRSTRLREELNLVKSELKEVREENRR